MWDRARASATAGLDRMHRRHLTGTAGGAASYEAPSADTPASEAPMPMSMSWTTISTSTSSSTFYQTTVDGPANALGIDIAANAAATPHRPLRPRRLPQLDAHSARVTSALHTGMYVWLQCSFCLFTQQRVHTQLAWRWLRHARHLSSVSCAGTISCCVIRQCLSSALPPQAHTGPLVEGTASSRCASNKEEQRKNKAPCSSASGILFSLEKLALVA